MRIRKASFSSLASNSPASSLSSGSSSSIATAITNNNNLASSTDSSSSFLYPSESNSNSATKCQGLDLLVKAIHMVTAGSVVGVPYIQRRVIRRRRRTSEFNRFIINRVGVVGVGERNLENVKTRSMMKRQKTAVFSH